MAKTKFYTVRKGRRPGVYNSWAECEAQVKGFKGAEFKSFASKSIAEHALTHGWEIGSKPNSGSQKKNVVEPQGYIKKSISVDAACSGNPGEMEFQGVDTDTGAQIFASDVYPVGTNNLGEFLAVVRALKHLYELNSDIPVYSDSVSAIAWVRNIRVNTNLKRNADTKKLWQDIDAAIQWLYDHDYQNPVLKWETKVWGEVKADFGRK
ncbi:ribonuclease H family protein [Virgibacillus sp. AGTR]|uniref:ribonuclease H1 domain-containing protein n=1 Tax=Virgibacillus sp. AGTR TaxID=2812055 RepID=UPI001D169F9A|nr:ribonuclease H family protein [Virgibacillus sp. AGTR]MCC2248877.1 ribonuclease H family protein [Virgibacillus sp. AGTR]